MDNILKKNMKGELIRFEFTGVNNFEKVIRSFDKALVVELRIFNIL